MHQVSQNMNPVNLFATEFGPMDTVDVPLDVPCLPLKTMAQFDAFQSQLLDEIYFKQVILFLGALGGNDTVDTTRRVLCKLMTNRLAMSFNWAGRQPKRAFRELRCRDLIIAAVRQNPMLPQPVLENDIEHSIKRWLRYASGRNH